MIGGKIWGEGTYGCVFHPPIKCDGEKKRRSGVGKIIKNMYDANEEIQIAKKIKKIDPKGNFTNPIIHDCMIKKSNITKKDEDNILCGATSTLNENKTYRQIIYRYKGEDLLQTTNKDFMKFFNLVNGLKLLQQNKICHRDIKEQNILSLKNKYIFIDFGLTTKTNLVYTQDEESILMYDYPYYPPEFKIFAIMNKLLKENVYNDPSTLTDDIFDTMDDADFIHVYRPFKAELKTLGVYKTIREDVFDAIDKIVHDTFHLSSKNKKRYFTNLAKYVDIFSLGIVMLNESNSEEGLYDRLSLDQSIKLNSIIKKTLSFNVFKRYDIDGLIDDFKELIGKSKTDKKCIQHFTKKTLKSISKKHNLNVSGNKQELYDRVKPHLKF